MKRMILAVTVAALALAIGLTTGVSGASAPTTNVHFTALDPPHQVLGNSSIGAGSTKLVIVSGGATTVPTNATTVQLTVTAKGSKAGTLTFYPAGNPGGSSGQTVSWPAGGSGTGTISTDIGQQNKLAFVNTSLASAVVTAIVVGFSTEVEARDVSGLGGNAGQVLTNNGAGGATWKTPATTAGYIDRSGFTSVPSTLTTLAKLTLPAGSYQVTAMTTLEGSGESLCELVNPNNQVAESRHGDPDAFESENVPLQMLLTTAGGTVVFRCSAVTGTSADQTSLVAVTLGSATGDVS